MKEISKYVNKIRPLLKKLRFLLLKIYPGVHHHFPHKTSQNSEPHRGFFR